MTPSLGGSCPGAPTSNAQARIDRVWLAQTHLMETDWPFFYLVEGRSALLKLDVSAPAGAAPTARVTASWPDQASEALCLRAPATLPTSTDMRAQPVSQDLGSSYVLTLPAAWLRAGLSLHLELQGGAAVSRSAAELKVGSSPELAMVIVNTLLFGDTQAQPVGDGVIEYASKLPVTRARVAMLPFDLSLPRMVVGPRSDSPLPQGGGSQSTAAQWADRLPNCWPGQAKPAGVTACQTYGAFAILSNTLLLAGALQKANGMTSVSLWYANHGLGSAVGGGLGGSSVGSGDDIGLLFNHEMGHAMGLPHLGNVTGTRQTQSSGLMHPYTGETPRGDGQPTGGGFGHTVAYDPLDNGLTPMTCAGNEMQDAMQRAGCTIVRPGRRFDHFSDFATYKLLRYFNGAGSVVNGTVPYYSRLLPGTGPDAFQPTAYRFPTDSGRPQLRLDAGHWSLHEWSAARGAYDEVLRPAGDTGHLSAPPAAPAGQRIERYYDFRYPQQFDVPVITVYGTFNYSTDATSTIYEARATRGHLMRLWDPTDPQQFDWIKSSRQGETFFWGYDLHLRVSYRDGTLRHVAMPYEAKPVADAFAGNGFVTWALNLPDDGRAIARIELLHRPLCARNGGDATMVCDVNLPANGITAANVYDGVRVAATWVAPP